jgi:hypothetical protein
MTPKEIDKLKNALYKFGETVAVEYLDNKVIIFIGKFVNSLSNVNKVGDLLKKHKVYDYAPYIDKFYQDNGYYFLILKK